MPLAARERDGVGRRRLDGVAERHAAGGDAVDRDVGDGPAGGRAGGRGLGEAPRCRRRARPSSGCSRSPRCAARTCPRRSPRRHHPRSRGSRSPSRGRPRPRVPGRRSRLERMLAPRLERPGHVEDLRDRPAGCRHDLDDRRLTERQRAGLVEDDGVDTVGGLERLAAADQDPASAPRPVPTMIAVGVARPMAHGQAMTRTLMNAASA